MEKQKWATEKNTVNAYGKRLHIYLKIYRDPYGGAEGRDTGGHCCVYLAYSATSIFDHACMPQQPFIATALT